MANPAIILQQIKTALEAHPHIGDIVYDGYVPEELPVDYYGYIKPYVVIWAGIGDDVNEPTLNAIHDGDGLIYDFQTTSVGPLPGHARGLASNVKAALVNLPAGTGRVKPNPDGFNQQTPIHDTQARPARFYLPSQWRLQTN